MYSIDNSFCVCFFFVFVFFQLCFKWVSVPSELPDQLIHNTIVGSILTKPEKRRGSNAALAHTVSVSKGVGVFIFYANNRSAAFPCMSLSVCACPRVQEARARRRKGRLVG